MDITLYNTMTRRKEAFAPLIPGKAGIYNCGPTVYDTPHIGNYRTFVMDDILRRVFEYNGYQVTQAMNVTDVDDKTIRRSREEGLPLRALAEKYEKLFLEGLASLGIETPAPLMRATDEIPAMIALIETLIASGAAYRAADGVYMSIAKAPGYGALAHLAPAAASASKERIANDEYDKDDPRDFALWKFATPEDSASGASWEAPFGAGRPGWHIECSAMAMKALGPTIDIHTGGSDLIFPHHVNEIAQSEAATGKPFARYWIHGAFVNVNAEKMAKSKGNFLKLEDLAEEAVSPLAYRYWLLTAHYRTPVDFSYDAVRAAQNALVRLIASVGELPDGGAVSSAHRERFMALVNDDLDMPRALALAWETLKDASLSPADARATLLDFDRVLGLRLADAPRLADEPAPPEIQALAEAREEARAAKDWAKADALRAEIESRGFELLDTPSGPNIRAL